MDIVITAKLLDQVGLVLGFISGCLLIPQIFDMLPLTGLEKSIERQLFRFESWTRFPLRYSPPSWKYRFTEEQRESIEPDTAIRSLMFSIIWIATLVIGIRFSSKSFIALSFIILVAVVIGNMKKHIPSLPLLSGVQKVLIFLSSLFLLVIITPPISLIRVIMVILRSVVSRTNRFFSAHDVLRTLLTILAIVAFIVSNILQFIATLL